MTLKGREITVLGGGIGGMTAALALARRGAKVVVLEQAGALSEVGAGIQISHNGMVVLRALDAVGRTPGRAVSSAGTELCDYQMGRLVYRMPPPAAGPTWYFHRADLLDHLEQAAREAGVKIQLGRRAVALEQEAGRAVLRLEGGETHVASCLIAADGVRGVARRAVAGPGKERFSGQVAWRAVVPWEGRGARPVATISMGPGRHVVTYPLRRCAAMNLVAVEDRFGWTEESWSREGDPGELRRRFSDFGGIAGQVLRGVDKVHLWALHLHPVATTWVSGAVALLGDAAHPTLPFAAQGACLAIEDAWVLADCLEAADTPEAGMARYQEARRPRAERVVAAARANAWRFHAHSPLRQIGQLGLRIAGRWLAPDYGWIYGHDVTKRSERG